MGQRTIMIGVFEREDDPVIEDEKRVLLALLRKLEIEGIKCSIKKTLAQGNLQVTAEITWQAENERKDLQIGRTVESLIPQVGKR